MPRKLRTTGLGSGIDKDRPDYTVFTGEWEIGRIYQTRGGPDNLRWFWSLVVNGPMTRTTGNLLNTSCPRAVIETVALQRFISTKFCISALSSVGSKPAATICASGSGETRSSHSSNLRRLAGKFFMQTPFVAG
jgi:hypothetical protein